MICTLLCTRANLTVINSYTHAEFVCYDDACHLRRFARNSVRADLTVQTKQLARVEMVVDKMHFKGQIDPWCKEHCDPARFEALRKVLIYSLNPRFHLSMLNKRACSSTHMQVDIEVCEQVFSWLSRFSRMTHKMSQHTFMFFLLYLCDLHNIREEKKLHRAGFM